MEQRDSQKQKKKNKTKLDSYTIYKKLPIQNGSYLK